MTHITGTTGGDTLYGTEAADSISGLGGDDRIRGRGGDDDIDGGHGRDKLWGDSGNDRLFGHDGSDQIYGGDGNDLAFGGNGTDWIFGNHGNDRLYGEAGDDTMVGDGGRDLLDGGTGNDVLVGATGNDSIDGGAGDDTALYRGSWSDYTIASAGGVTHITDLNGSDGNDGSDSLRHVEWARFGDGTVVDLGGAHPVDWVQWTAAEGGNGHWYAAVEAPQGIDWTEARDAAGHLATDAHLATATSAAENSFIFDLVRSDDGFWFNGDGPWLGGFEQGSTWHWVTGEAFDYQDWFPGQPDHGVPPQQYLHYWPDRTQPTWDNHFNDGHGHGLTGYIAELDGAPAGLADLGVAAVTAAETDGFA